MKILFVTHTYPNYVPDLLLHGLRKLLGSAVVDYPRKDCLYEGIFGLGLCPDDQRCPGLGLASAPQRYLEQSQKKGYFDAVVCDLRAIPLLANHLKDWPRHSVVVDGEDHAQRVATGPYIVCRRETDGSDFSIPLPMALPEELLHWITHYDGLAKTYSIGFLGSTHDGTRKRLLESLARYYPDALFQATAVPSGDQPLPAGRFGRDDYYRYLQQCRIVLSLAGAGYDTFRFWENAAVNAVHAAAAMPLFIPDDFVAGNEILRFETAEDLRRTIDALFSVEEKSKDMILQGRQKLVSRHLTTHRATYFIDRIRRAFG